MSAGRGSRQHRGYILLPVVVTIALVAAIALLMNQEGSMAVRASSSELEAERADLVAEAGLNHALWEIERKGCGPYTEVTDMGFGAHRYSTQIVPNNAGGQITTYTVQVSDDAWIRSDRSSDNYGGDTQLSTYFNLFPSSTKRTLYRFDIQNAGIPSNAILVSATARIFIIDSNERADVTVHRITADWSESTVNWDNINSSHDSNALATIPEDSPAGGYVSINITSLVQGWLNGSTPNQGIMLKTSSILDLAEYTSKEYGNADQRPLLEIQVTDGSLSNRATISVQAELDNGTSRSLTREDQPLYQAPSSTLTLQPDAAQGKDTWVTADQPSNNYGVTGEMVVSGGNDPKYFLDRFDLSAIPFGSRILSARLEMYLGYLDSNDPAGTFSIFPMTQDWSEGSGDWWNPGDGVSWDTADGSTAWSWSDNHRSARPVATTQVDPAFSGPHSWEIRSLVQQWVSGETPNFGLVLKGDERITGAGFYSSDYSTASKRPRLSISYSCECGVSCQAPAGTGKVLLVVGDAASPDPDDLYRRQLFGDWGYTVSLIDDDTNQAGFDSAFADNDVVYVSETVLDTTVGDKLDATAIGVVSEEGGLLDNLGIASGSSNGSGRNLTILDNSHYITELFPQAVIPIYSADMEGLNATGSLATDLQVLANWGSTPGLAVIDRGGTLSDGSSRAAGRRVMLPLGRDGRLNWRRLNNNGRLMIQRALQWAAEPPAMLAHWKLDDGTGGTATDAMGSHDGTLNNGPNWTSGQIDGALAFDGVDDSITVPHDDALSLTEAMTFTAWVRVSAFDSNYQTILNKDGGGSDSNFWFGTWQQDMLFGFFSGGSFVGVYTTDLNLQTDTWYHLAVSFDNATDQVSLYRDGALVETSILTQSPTAVDADLTIGTSPYGEYWNGLLDDVRIYDQILEPAEIADLAGAGGAGGGDPPPPPGGCNGTFRDQFDNISFSNNDGTLNWSGDWIEINESDGPGSGDERVRDDNGPYQLWIRDNDGGGEGVEREADLSGAAAATLSFLYRRSGLDKDTDYVALSISANGSAGPWTELARFQGPATDSDYLSFSQDISAYIASTTRIRFLTSSGMGNLDTVMIDDLQIQCSP